MTVVGLIKEIFVGFLACLTHRRFAPAAIEAFGAAYRRLDDHTLCARVDRIELTRLLAAGDVLLRNAEVRFGKRGGVPAVRGNHANGIDAAIEAVPRWLASGKSSQEVSGLELVFISDAALPDATSCDLVLHFKDRVWTRWSLSIRCPLEES